MQSLVQEELAFQVFPGAYIYEIPGFFEMFNTYIDHLGNREIKIRRQHFADGETFKIHIEKMDEIVTYLSRQRLAHHHGPWYDVERETADDFMSYLACSLGQVQSIDSSPVTDEIGYLRRFARAGVRERVITQQLDSLRVQVLDEVLPVPSQHIQPTRIRLFKEKHCKEPSLFRCLVERELVEALAIPDPVLRQRHIEIFLDEAAASIQEIQEAIRSAGWEIARAGYSVLAAVPGVSPLVGLAGALWKAITGGHHKHHANLHTRRMLKQSLRNVLPERKELTIVCWSVPIRRDSILSY